MCKLNHLQVLIADAVIYRGWNSTCILKTLILASWKTCRNICVNNMFIVSTNCTNIDSARKVLASESQNDIPVTCTYTCTCTYKSQIHKILGK